MTQLSNFNVVADVGGTNIRLACVGNSASELNNIHAYKCGDFSTLFDAIKQYQSDINCDQISSLTIAIACPVENDLVEMTNHHWKFTKSALKEALNLESLFVINDFTAVAMSIPFIKEDQKVQIGGQSAVADKPIAVFGAGTGLGVGHLVPFQDKWIPLPGEGGHVDFAPIDDEDIVVWRNLNAQLSHVSYEQLLSGFGLVQIYKALTSDSNSSITPAEITTKAISNECEHCLQTLNLFCRVLGSFGGNLALNLGTLGGVYIAGGIVPRFIEFVKTSEFRTRFEQKGRFEKYVSSIPVFVVTEDQPGLLGAAAFSLQSIKG